MTKKRALYKNWIIIAVIISLWLPFAFFSSFYPFYRYGMFAEIGSSQNQPSESFEIYYSRNHNKHKFEAPLIGMNASTFEYLQRNYYYRNNSEKILRTIISRLDNADTFQWELFRFSSDSRDSTLLVVIPAVQ